MVQMAVLGSKVEERDSRLSEQKDCFDELDRNYMATKAEKDNMDSEKVHPPPELSSFEARLLCFRSRPAMHGLTMCIFTMASWRDWNIESTQLVPQRKRDQDRIGVGVTHTNHVVTEAAGGQGDRAGGSQPRAGSRGGCGCAGVSGLLV